MIEEAWVDIKDYEGLYQASPEGYVKSLARIVYRIRNGKPVAQFVEEKILRGAVHQNGYTCVTLYKDRKGSVKLLHRIIAETFIPNPDKLPVVDHIDTDKTNNRVENLRWVTQKENNHNPLSRLKRKYRIGDRLARDIARDNGICSTTFGNRMHRGWSVEDACTIPVKGAKTC